MTKINALCDSAIFRLLRTQFERDIYQKIQGNILYSKANIYKIPSAKYVFLHQQWLFYFQLISLQGNIVNKTGKSLFSNTQIG